MDRGPFNGRRHDLCQPLLKGETHGEADAEVEGYPTVTCNTVASRSPGGWSRRLRWAWMRRAKGAWQTGGLVGSQRGCTAAAARGTAHDSYAVEETAGICHACEGLRWLQRA